MRFWAIANFEIGEATDLFIDRGAAESALDEILREEPGFADTLGLVLIDFEAMSPVTTIVRDPRQPSMG